MKLELRLAASLALFAIAGCNQQGKEQHVQGTAGGEILEASVSDAMLPADRVRSQPPLAPRTEGGGDDAKANGKKEAGSRAGRNDRGSQGPADSAPAAEPADAGGGDGGGGEAPMPDAE